MSSITHAHMSRRALVRGGLGVAAGIALAPVAGTLGPVLGASAATRLLRRGNSGSDVAALQRSLANSAFWCGSADGSFGHLTQQAVWALQKHHGLVRDGVVGPATRAALATGSRPTPQFGGTGVEVHLGDQLMLVVRDGSTREVYNTSTGNGEWYTLNGRRQRAVTPKGSWRVYSTYSDGWQAGPLGNMWRPMYYNSGWAIHGSTSIPTYPASHGCSRLSTAAMDRLWQKGWLAMGTRVRITG